MTIEQVKFWVDNVFDSYDDKLNKDEIEEAKRIVNKSLDAVTIKALEQQPCDDCISRKATVERLCKIADFMNEKRSGLGSPYIMAALFIQDNKEEFPPVTPKEKTGKWIYKQGIFGAAYCSECDFELKTNNTKFCPNCGARMVSE